MKLNSNIKKGVAIALLLFGGTLAAQQDLMVSQYMFSGHFLNPAYAGSHDYANLTVLGRKQWVGFAGSPLSTYMSFDMPLKEKKIGFGGLISNDFIGVTNRTDVAGTFSYHLKIGAKAKLAVGIRAGVTYYTAKLSDLIYWDQQDAVFQNDIKGKVLPNSGLGVYFYLPRFYAGISVPNVINYKPGTAIALGITDAPHLERHYFATAGVVIPAGTNLEIKPALLVKYLPNAPIQADFNLNFLFYKTLWVGGSYRTGDGIQGMVEYQATEKLRVGYAYDFAFTSMNQYNSGSHEIMIAWDFIKEEKIRYRSPRFF
jgi:hypothetical protein